MRCLLLLALIAAGCGGLGFDEEQAPTDEKTCAAMGGKLVPRDGWLVCDVPADLAYAAAKGAHAQAGDAAAQD